MIKEYTWLLCYTLCQWFTGHFHMLILTRYVPMEEVGLYGFAYKLYSVSLMVVYAINTVLLPTFSEIKDRESLRYKFQKVMRSTPIVSLLYMFSLPFLGLFIEITAGTRYAGATTMLQILIVGTAISTILSPGVNVLFALNRFKLVALGGFLLALTSIIGNLTLTRKMGGSGAAVVQVGCHAILGLWTTYHALRLLYARHEMA
jgi:O-antigen/teichoic acid export membrane protein